MWNTLANSGAAKAPISPVSRTATIVMATTPPWLSAMPTAMGVVQLLGSSALVMESSSPKALHSRNTLPMLVMLPAVPPREDRPEVLF